MRKKLIAFVMACLLITNGFGWGSTGHRATGLVAEGYLTAKAKKKLAVILGQESIAMASVWMDDIRSDSLYNYTNDWHFTTVPDGKKYEDIADHPEGKLVAMIEKTIADLKSGKLDAKKEKESLKMLIHMIGDLHQPLHVGKVGDKGGNDVKVKWFGRDTNLHTVWDSEMINDTRLSYTELANSLIRPDKDVILKWQTISPRAWADESITYRPQVYDVGNGSLGYQYQYKYFHIARLRMLQAGVRIGAVLNDIYGK